MFLNQECKYCGEQFHYCASCDFDEPRSFGFCSDECCNKYNYREEFEKWFNKLVEKQESDFERMVIESSKYDLWDSWVHEMKFVK